MIYKIYVLTLVLFLVPSMLYAEKTKDEVLNDIVNYDTSDISMTHKNSFEGMRPKAIAEAAKTIAFQKAVRWRYDMIMEIIDGNEISINSIFDFNRLLMNNGRLLPPVIVEGKRGLRIESDKKATEVAASYEIIKDAKIVSNPPSWRDYLYREYQAAETINPALIPKNEEERDIWANSALKSFHDGIEYAEELFKVNLRRMVRDFKGILRFKILAEQNIVNVPMLAEGEYGIIVEGKRLDVDQKVFRITNDIVFQDVDEWSPKVGSHEQF